jgi:hypothetical protein
VPGGGEATMRRMANRKAGAVLAAALMALALAGCDDEPTVVLDVIPPAAPQALYSVTGDGRVTLEWVRNTEPDFSYYNVWRGPAYDGPFAKLGTTASTSYVDETAENAVTYYFAVSAVDRSGNESDLSVEVVFDTPRPEGSGLTLVNATTAPGGLSGYDFSVATRRNAAHLETDFFYATGSGGLCFLVARDAGRRLGRGLRGRGHPRALLLRLDTRQPLRQGAGDRPERLVRGPRLGVSAGGGQSRAGPRDPERAAVPRGGGGGGQAVGRVTDSRADRPRRRRRRPAR